MTLGNGGAACDRQVLPLALIPTACWRGNGGDGRQNVLTDKYRTLRSTRRLQLTDAGENFYRRAQEILKTANALFDEMADMAREPSGTLRLTMPFDYGTQVIVPVMAAFCERYSRCRVEANFSDTRQDLMSGRHELAIRAGWAVDEQASSRLLGHFRQLLVAPASWRLPAQPDTPAGLTSLPFVANAALRHPNDWCFSRGETRVEVRLAARVSLDSTLAVRAAVLAGVGMAILPDYMVQPALDAGQLQCRAVADTAAGVEAGARRDQADVPAGQASSGPREGFCGHAGGQPAGWGGSRTGASGVMKALARRHLTGHGRSHP